MPTQKKLPRVTLLVPCFDATLAGAALASALAQDYANLEIIVAPDDGRSYAHLRLAFPSPRLRILAPCRRIATGAGASRNRALDAATGDYITMLDADDVLAPGYIAALMRIAQQDGAAVAPIRYLNDDLSRILRIPPAPGPSLTLAGFSRLLASMHPLIHRSLESGYADGFAEDVIHDGLLMAKLGGIRVAATVAYLARTRHGSSCNGDAAAERAIRRAYALRVEQILRRPTQLGMQFLGGAEREEFADLFRFRAAVSRRFSAAGAPCYNSWVAGREADLWRDYRDYGDAGAANGTGARWPPLIPISIEAREESIT